RVQQHPSKRLTASACWIIAASLRRVFRRVRRGSDVHHSGTRAQEQTIRNNLLPASVAGHLRRNQLERDGHRVRVDDVGDRWRVVVLVFALPGLLAGRTTGDLLRRNLAALSRNNSVKNKCRLGWSRGGSCFHRELYYRDLQSGWSSLSWTCILKHGVQALAW